MLPCMRERTRTPSLPREGMLGRRMVGMDGAQSLPRMAALNEQRVDAYVKRLGVGRPTQINAATLIDLHQRHLQTFPFENLSIHLGEPIVLDPDALVDKLTLRGRGGFCYELNGAFAALLTTLGFDVTMFEARVGAGGDGMPFDHLCLRVRVADGEYLADVGFGASFLRPLDLRRAAPQADPAGTYQVIAAGINWFDMVENGEAQYRFSTVARRLADFADACHFHQTSPDSHFTQDTICSLATPTGRVTISGQTLIITENGERAEQPIESDDELLELYQRHFGIVLEHPPKRRTDSVR
jgi:N-hydroxyarylamine O-acetyltransferase